jgi:type IV secretion system protein VirD4
VSDLRKAVTVVGLVAAGFVAWLIVTPPLATALVVVAMGTPAVLLRSTVFSSDRIRSAKWRVKFLMHPGPGWATYGELYSRWGRVAALHHGKRARPSLKLRHRLILATATYAVYLGRGQWGRRLYARNEDERLIIAAKRTGKTGLVADRIVCHRGPAVSSTSKTDVYDMTAGIRAEYSGPVWRFNPMGVGDVPNDVRFDIMACCKDVLMARTLGSWLKIPDVTGNDLAWFSHKGDVALGAILWAAAVSGRTILDVYDWVQLRGHDECLKVLATHPGSSPQMHAVAKRTFEENRTSGSIRDTIDLSLSWVTLPGLADIVTPPPGRGFSVERFLDQNGTLYLIATGDDDSPVTPLFRALTHWVAYQAGMIGSKSQHKRCEPPVLFSMDELAVTNPIDLVSLLTDSSSKGLLFEPVIHSLSQLIRKYGEHAAHDIWALCGTKVFLGAISDPKTLDEASKLCGKAPGAEHGEMTLEPELLRQLPPWRGVCIRMELAPAAFKIRPFWHRWQVRLGRWPLSAPHLAPAPQSAPAIESVPAVGEAETPVPSAMNSHGGKPGQLVKADP